MAASRPERGLVKSGIAMSAQRASAGVHGGLGEHDGIGRGRGFVQALGDDPLVALRIARHQPGARTGEDNGADLDLLAGAARGVRDEIGGGPDGGRQRRRDGDAPPGLDRRLRHGPVDPEDRHGCLRRRIVGAGADRRAGAEHHACAVRRLQQSLSRARPDLVGQRARVDGIRKQRGLNHVTDRNVGVDLGAQLVEQVGERRHRVHHDQIAAHRPLLRDRAPPAVPTR